MGGGGRIRTEFLERAALDHWRDSTRHTYCAGPGSPAGRNAHDSEGHT